jgi:hypothetical protein
MMKALKVGIIQNLRSVVINEEVVEGVEIGQKRKSHQQGQQQRIASAY